MHHIAVIGGSGFIGTSLVKTLLAQEHTVRIIDRNPSSAYPELVHLADVRDTPALLRACSGCDVIYNLAAEHRDDVRPLSLYHEVNVGGAVNTCEVAATLGIETIIFTSTVAVYGFPNGEFDENAPPAPFNAYGQSKLEAEQVFEAWAAAEPGRALTIARPTVVFGPGNRGNVYLLLEQIARGRAVIIGDGRNRKSMAYVENVADLLAYALAHVGGIQLYNYIDKPDLDMNALVGTVNRALGQKRCLRIPYPLGLAIGRACDGLARLSRRSLPISSVRVQKYAASTQFAARRVLESGFQPRHSLTDALATTVAHEFGPTRA